MGNNVEWKATVYEPERQRALAEQLAGSAPQLLHQSDTFFHVANGRLKLRQFSSASGELIHYLRPDQPGPKQSVYSLFRTDQPDELRDLLARSLGVLGVVRKKRWLYLAEQTRIHFDEVDGLGTFLEVEVVLQLNQSVKEGEQIAEEMRGRLD